MQQSTVKITQDSNLVNSLENAECAFFYFDHNSAYFSKIIMTFRLRSKAIRFAERCVSITLAKHGKVSMITFKGNEKHFACV